MIVYKSNKKDFLKDASNSIEDIISNKVQEALNIHTKKDGSEYNSWRNSLGNAMYHVMNTDKIPDDAGVAIEYSIQRTKNRVDFIITGKNENGNDNLIIIELKQWTDVQMVDKDAMVKTFFKQGYKEVIHPSYQAWSYASLLFDFNEVVYKENIGLSPCAYLHNYDDNNILSNDFYGYYIEKAPLFFKSDKEKLQDFISKYIKYGDNKDVLYRIENGEIRPSKNLADRLSSMIKGNIEFIMIDDQKIIYEEALDLAKKSNANNKNILIVEGGPGTGKSVIAINLLVGMTNLGLNSRYITKNAAPRAVFESKLTGVLTKTSISNMFTSSGAYIGCESNKFDALIIDEAHRLNEKSGIFKNLGENQIKEIMEASKFSVFFIDEDQKVTWNDIGNKEEIERWANKLNIKIHNLKLESQFRCNGSDGYLSWLNNVLQIKETANLDLKGINYDFKVFDSPEDLRKTIFEKNLINNKSRIVAGYCWDWVSKKDKNLYDIELKDYNFRMKWNLESDGNTWIISEKSVSEIGCIHTCQGLELDYIGVIIGEDLIIRDGMIITQPNKRAKTDKSLNGYKRDLKTNKEEANKKADAIIKNTYRTLMTRGMKGCFIYCVDKETNEYFKNRLNKI